MNLKALAAIVSVKSLLKTTVYNSTLVKQGRREFNTILASTLTLRKQGFPTHFELALMMVFLAFPVSNMLLLLTRKMLLIVKDK